VLSISEPRAFTLSIHEQHNCPAAKPPSSLDVGLPDGTGDTVAIHVNSVLAAAGVFG
jgi:hypothetical protein